MRPYHLLLRLYPASFRHEYGGEMAGAFHARLRATRGTGPLLALWADTIGDVMRNALAAHWDILRQDLRYTARSFARTPGFVVTAVLVTALGIGANTAAFSVADFVLLRPLPYADPDRLLKLAETSPDGGTNQVSPAIYRDWTNASRALAATGAWYGRGANLVGEGEPQHLDQAVVTTSLLPMLGVRPLRGRLFVAQDEREASTIILGEALWRSRFGGDEAVIGKRVLTDGVPRTVIGVMPATFHFPRRNIAFWTPMTLAEQADDDRTNTYWEVVARMRPGVTLAQARAEMGEIGASLARQFPAELEGVGVAVTPLGEELSSQSRMLLLALSAAAACVLLIACANLANLLLARALARRRELLVRTALGAGRERLVRQSITESLVLAFAGGALGIVVAAVTLPLLTRLVPNTLPIAQAPSIDARIIIFATLLSAITGIAFGALPAWRSASSPDLGGLREGARGGGGRRERARAAIVIVEVMASVVLLVSAGLLLRALVRLQDTDPGFRTENVMVLRTALSSPKYDVTARRSAFYRGVLGEVRALPGVSSAAYISGLPMASSGAVWPVSLEGAGPVGTRSPHAVSRYVTPGYFATLGIPLRAGRDVSESDGDGSPWVAVVSESFARRSWPGQDPIGKRFTLLNDMRTVVGVVGDVRSRGPERPSEPQAYLSYQQVAEQSPAFFYPRELVIRTTAPGPSLVPAVRRAVQRVDADQPVSDVRPMEEIVSDATGARSVQLRVIGAFALVAFLLAAVGIHGLLSFSVSSRQHEIGVRMALGARRSEVVRLVVRQGAMLAVAGLVPGLVLAYTAGRAMEGILAGVRPADGATFGAVALLCLAMTVAGTLAPALRAVHVDPARALRAEA